MSVEFIGTIQSPQVSPTHLPQGQAADPVHAGARKGG